MNKAKTMTTGTIRVSAMVAVLAVSAAGFPARAGFNKSDYSVLEGKSGQGLVEAVKSLASGHKEISYSSGTWEAFEKTDTRVVNGVLCWWDMYSADNVAVSSGHPGMNVEHSIANSWWGGTKNAAYKDIVHLNPSNADANSRKSNYPFAELQSVTWTNGVTSVGKPKTGQGGGSSYGYEPADEYKGDFARVCMYMFTTYNDISWKSSTAWMYTTEQPVQFKQWAVELLMRWHKEDPVSDKERTRNDGIKSCQWNRNPFIDLPDLAEYIWGDKKGNAYHIEGGGGTPDPGEPEDEYEWISPDGSNTEGWEFTDTDNPSGLDRIWTTGDYNGVHYIKASAYVGGTAYSSESYAYSPVVSLEGAREVKLSFSHAAKFQTTLKNLCKVAVRDADTDETELVEIPSWPSAGNWTYVPSGEIDLSRFAGKRVRVGFRYASSASEGADTWQVNDVRLAVTGSDSGVCGPWDVETGEGDDSFLVEVWGNDIFVPAGARIFDMEGREVSGKGLAKGVYIVIKPSFAKNVKVRI